MKYLLTALFLSLPTFAGEDILSFDRHFPIQDNNFMLYSHPYLYQTNSAKALLIHDMSNVLNPRVVGRLFFEESVDEMALNGTTLYIYSANELLVVDVTDPTAPVLQNEAACSFCKAFRVAGDYLYATGWRTNDRFRVFNLTDPLNPTETTNFNTAGAAQGFEIVNGYMFLPGGETRNLMVYSLADPGVPKLVTTYAAGIDVFDVAIDGNRAYLAAGSKLLTLDIQDPEHPSQVHELTLDTKAGLVKRRGDFLITRPYLQVIEKANPDQPSVLKSDLDLYIRDITVGPQELAFLDDGNGFAILDIPHWVYDDPKQGSLPQYIHHLNTGQIPSQVAHYQGVTYLPYSNGVLVMVDMTTTQPVLLGADLTLAGHMIEIVGGQMVLASETTLKVVSLEEPTQPQLLGEVSTEGITSLEVAGDHAYPSTGDKLHIVDLTDPANPTMLGELEVSVPFTQVHVYQDTAYLAADDAGILIIDLSDRTNPQEVGAYTNYDNVSSLDGSGDMLYASVYEDGVLFLKLTDPHNPLLIFRKAPISFRRTESVTVRGNYLFEQYITFNGIADYYHHIVDVSNPFDPNIRGRIYTRGRPVLSQGLYLVPDRQSYSYAVSGLEFPYPTELILPEWSRTNNILVLVQFINDHVTELHRVRGERR